MLKTWGIFMADLKWETWNEGAAIMMGQFALIREMAVELRQLDKLDDQTLERIEQCAIRKMKGRLFNGDNIPPDQDQVRLIDFSLNAIYAGLAHIKTNRDNGNLDG
jgi:hypothetical protein